MYLLHHTGFYTPVCLYVYLSLIGGQGYGQTFRPRDFPCDLAAFKLLHFYEQYWMGDEKVEV
jgi:hypothetical protein